MGVPKFFRYMSERYPCLNEKVREYQIPEFDNLYLDMNGIIHVCSHPDDNPLQSIPEEVIFKDIFYYIELMFRLIQPKKLFMMAVDGVAPRAKMNQQRGRRFRTAKDAEVAAARAVCTGLPVPSDDRFDSNCITPGTEFMDRLHQQLQYFVQYKISTDKLWRRPKIILSGHDTPGEGEHKIMDYIRYLRTRDDWQPNTRHCLHGLDADLIMLGLCSHELHFSLLREEVKFGKSQKRPTNPEEIQFFLLHLSLMRDYLDLEFQALKKTLPFPYDLEKIVDDWVLMGFLVGNDFIPNLPSLHINENALHTLYQVYIDILPSLGGYINEAGVLNLERFEKYMGKLAELDFEHFREIESDLAYFDAKTSNKKLRRSIESLNEDHSNNEEIMNMINATKNALCNTEEEKMQWDRQNTEDDIRNEFKKYKTKYYMEKMHFKEVTDEVLRCQAECFIRAIQWNLHYYYHGCPSWSWHYPFHYAPFISDIKDFCYLGQLEFDLGKPFTPYQQLLGVLPPASRKILPEAFQHLMTSKESPIVEFYPDDFETDLNGKQHMWEAIVLLPFIDQDALVAAMEPYYKDLTGEEQRRNNFGPMTVYEYTPEDLGSREAPNYFPPVVSNHAREHKVWLKEIKVPKEKLVLGLLPGAQDSFWYGFPTLKCLPFEGKLEDAKVHVFQQPSRGLNMMLYLKGVRSSNDDSESIETLSIEEASRKYLGKEVYVGWPHLVKAYVTCLTDMNYKYTLNKNNEAVGSELKREEIFYWSMYGQELSVLNRNTFGIEIGQVEIIVFAKQLVGTKFEFNDKGEAIKKPCWSETESHFALQTIVENVNMLPCDKTCGGNTVLKPLNEVFPKDQVAFLVRAPYYGAEVKVIDTTNKGTLMIEIQNKPEPDVTQVLDLIDRSSSNEKYYQGSVAANMCGLKTHLLSRITGTIYVRTSDCDSNMKVNIGLNLKFNKSNQEIVGYTKKVSGRYWNYSEKAVDLIKEYVEKFPSVVNYLCSTNQDVYDKTDFFKEDADIKVQEITKWLAEHPYNKAERRNFNSDILSEASVKELEKIIVSGNWNTMDTTVIEVKPDDLRLPVCQINLMEPDPKADHQLMDRVVNIRECHPVPLGIKGFIIGIEKKEDEKSTLYDIIFDIPVTGGFQLHTEAKRCYRLTRHGFLNLSHGRRIFLNLGEKLPKTGIQNKKPTSSRVFTSKNSVSGCSTGIQGLNLNSDSKSPSAAQSQQTSSAKMEQNLRPDYSSGSNNVSNFFSAYRSPSFVNTVGQQPSPGPFQQQSPLRQVGGAFQAAPQPNANTEFQAMWNHLQHQKVPSDPLTIPPPINTATPKLSSAANEALGRSPQQKSCSHAVSCCAALINYCQRTGCAYPVYGYMTNNITKEVTAVISFPDGRQFKGLPSKEKSTAAETAACLTLNSLTEGKQVLPGRQMMKFGTAGNNLIGGQQPVVPFHQQTLARLNTQMTSLPSPPHQWCQPNKRENWRFQDNFQDQQHRPSPSFSANNFVPLQAQVARVQSNQQQQHLNKDLLKPTAQQPSVPQQELNNQVGNTADNTITSANNDSAKVNEDVGGPIKVIAPHLILGDNKCMSTSADNPAKTSGMVGGIITATQQRRPPFQPRTRSRLAARFSVPINNPAAAATSSSQQLQQNNLLK